MKRFSEFAKKLNVEPTLILAQPVHGSHAKPTEPTVIFAQPTHGRHSRITEKVAATKTSDWLNHNDNSHLGKDVHEVHAKLNTSKEEFHDGDHHHSVLHYTNQGSHWINGELIHKAKHPSSSVFDSSPSASASTKAFNEKRKQETHEHIDHIEKKISKSKLKHDVHLYHGTDKWHPGKEAAKNKDGKVKLPAFTSTSIHKDIAHGFIDEPSKGGHILHIHAKKGQHGLYVGHHSEHDEKEMILQRNTTLKIHPHPTKLGDGTHVWHAHITDD